MVNNHEAFCGVLYSDDKKKVANHGLLVYESIILNTIDYRMVVNQLTTEGGPHCSDDHKLLFGSLPVERFDCSLPHLVEASMI